MWSLVGSSFLAVAVETASSALPAWPRRSDAHDDIVEVRPRLFARSEQMSGESRSRLGLFLLLKGVPRERWVPCLNSYVYRHVC